MRYRSLLFSGVLITAIASLPIVQSCTNKQERAGTDSDRADTKQDRESTESDLASKRDFELASASAQAQSYLQKYFLAETKGYRTTTEKLDSDRYLQNKLILKNYCESGYQDGCKLLLQIQQIEIKMKEAVGITNLIGK